MSAAQHAGLLYNPECKWVENINFNEAEGATVIGGLKQVHLKTQGSVVITFILYIDLFT